MSDPTAAPLGAGLPFAASNGNGAHPASNGAHAAGGPAGGLQQAAILADAQAEVPRLRSGPNPASFLRELDLAFERAADASLADPALAERSRRLRALARRVVPEPWRPAAKRLALQADAAARRWPMLLRVGRELGELVDEMSREVVALEGPARQALRRADAAARANPAVYGTLRQVNRLVERSAHDEQLPPPLRRAAQLAEHAARRARSLVAR